MYPLKSSEFPKAYRSMLGAWSQDAGAEYERKVKGFSEEERENYRLELLAKLGKIVKEEVKGVSPVMRMNRIEKDIIQLVSYAPTLCERTLTWTQQVTGISQDNPDLHLFVIKVYTGDDPAAKGSNGVITGTRRGHETLQDLPLDLDKWIGFLYNHLR